MARSHKNLDSPVRVGLRRHSPAPGGPRGWRRQTVCRRSRLHDERQLLPRPDVDVLGMRLSAALRNL